MSMPLCILPHLGPKGEVRTPAEGFTNIPVEIPEGAAFVPFFTTHFCISFTVYSLETYSGDEIYPVYDANSIFRYVDFYESKEAYFADFTAMNEIIKNQTGQYSKIFRFPGGSSNVVSKQYSSGIITELSKDLKKSGYLVYDWHIDCADTVHKTSGAVFNQVKKSLKTDRPNIILMHDIKLHTVNAVPQIIEYALANGYRFAVIDENTPTHQLTIAN